MVRGATLAECVTNLADQTGLKPGKLVLIEAGDRHEIRNTGRSLLKTISVYVPPAYRDEETELPAGKGA